MEEKKSHPELVGLIKRLQEENRPKDANICVMALYVLHLQDKKIKEMWKANDRHIR